MPYSINLLVMASNPRSDGLQLKSDGLKHLKPNSDGLHFSAFPQKSGAAACGGGYQELNYVKVTARPLRCLRRVDRLHGSGEEISQQHEIALVESCS